MPIEGKPRTIGLAMAVYIQSVSLGEYPSSSKKSTAAFLNGCLNCLSNSTLKREPVPESMQNLRAKAEPQLKRYN